MAASSSSTSVEVNITNPLPWFSSKISTFSQHTPSFLVWLWHHTLRNSSESSHKKTGQGALFGASYHGHLDVGRSSRGFGTDHELGLGGKSSLTKGVCTNYIWGTPVWLRLQGPTQNPLNMRCCKGLEN